MVDIVPEIETELGRLDRDYNVIKSQYQQLVQRREQMRLGYEAGQSGESVELRVIEPPREPVNPTGPNRLLFLLATFGGALGMGGAIAFVLSQLNPRVFTSRELKEVTGIPVLGAVSLCGGKQHRMQRLGEILFFGSGLAGLTLMFMVLVSLQLMGVDLYPYVSSIVGLVS